MTLLRFFFVTITAVSSLAMVSCETLDNKAKPKPEREKLSSMPHNIPAPWEGQAGMPGMMSGNY